MRGNMEIWDFPHALYYATSSTVWRGERKDKDKKEKQSRNIRQEEPLEFSPVEPHATRYDSKNNSFAMAPDALVVRHARREGIIPRLVFHLFLRLTPPRCPSNSRAHQGAC